MNYIKSTLISVTHIFLSVSFILVLMNCSSSGGDDPGPELTAEEKQLNLLAKNWDVKKVEYDSDDVTNRFTGFTLTLTKNKSYTTTPDRGGYDFEPFKSTGTWVFKDGNLNVLDRNDGVIMDIVVNESSLNITFMITEANGRLAGLGEYKFELTAQ